MQTGTDNVVIGNTLIDGGVTDGTLVDNAVLDETVSDNAIAEHLLENNAEFSPPEIFSAETSPSEVDSTPLQPSTPSQPEYNGINRNAWIFGFNPQAELWNGRLAMVGFMAYLLWDIGGYSVLRDVFHFVH